MRAQQEHVPLHRLDREVLVDGADEGVAGLHQHAVVTRLGDRPAGGQRRKARAAPCAQAPVDAIAVDVGHAPPAPRLDARRDELHDLLELLAPHALVRGGAPDELQQLVLADALLAPRGHLGDDLLGEDVKRLLGRVQRIEAPAPDRRQQRGALDELVARGRVDDAARDAGAVVVCAAHPLQEGGDAVRRADLADQLDGADVDSQLQRRRGDQRAKLAGAQAPLHPLAALARERAVVGRHLVCAQALAELVRHALGHLARVDEYQRRAMAGHVRRDAVEYLAQLVCRDGGLELAVGQLQRELERALVAAVDHRRQRAGSADQEAAGLLYWPHGRRQADAQRRPPGDGFQALQRKRQVRAALVSRERMDLVDDDRLHRLQRRARALCGEVEVQRLGRRHEQVGRPADHHLALVRGRVSGADGDRYRRRRHAELARHLRDLRQGLFEVGVHVYRECLQRAQVDDRGGARDRLARLVGAIEGVDRREEARQRLARARGRADQRVAAGEDLRPAAGLRLGRTLGEATRKPLPHGRVKALGNRVRAGARGGRGRADCHVCRP